MSASRATAAPVARPAPPPREVTAAALVVGLATAQRLIGPASLALAFVLMVEVAIRSGDAASFGAIALWWAPAFVMSIVLAIRPVWTVALVTSAVGLIASTGYVATMLQAYTEQQSRGSFLIESLAWALMFIGAVRPKALDGVVSVLVGLAVGTVAIVAGYLVAGREIVLSPDRLTDAVIMAATYAVIAIGGQRRRDRVPQLPDAALVSRRQNAARNRERAAAALVHDTVLASLTLVGRASGELDERVRRGIRRDLDAVAQASATSVGVVSAAPVEGSLAARLLAVVDELRWKGLRVDLGGAETLGGDALITDSAAEAVLAATSAALENVLRHAGTDRAEVTTGRTGTALTVMIVDAGHGFAPDDVPADRLGLRESIRGRLARVGGTTRVWSSELGTTVLLTVPLVEPEVAP